MPNCSTPPCELPTLFPMYSSNLGVFTVFGLIAGLGALFAAAVDVALATTVGEAFTTSWSEFAATVACWTLAAAVEIVARGRRRRWWDLWSRALGAALLALAACAISFLTVMVAGIDGFIGWALFGIGWIALMVRPMRRVLGPDAV